MQDSMMLVYVLDVLMHVSMWCLCYDDVIPDV